MASTTRPGMRIYALPISRALPGRPALVYYLASLPPKEQPKDGESRTAAVTRWGTTKLTDTWTKWGNMDSGWQRRIYDFGQRAQAKIDFEELALRSIDPALGPKLTSKGEGGKLVDGLGQSDDTKKTQVPLYYPSVFPSVVDEAPLSHLENHLVHHEPKHKRRFYGYTASIPFTAPFMLVPVIPNIPFFFVAWRAWSNYKAFKASDYLASLLKAGAIHPTRSSALDRHYRITSSSSSPKSSSSPSSPSSPSSTPTSQPESTDSEAAVRADASPIPPEASSPPPSSSSPSPDSPAAAEESDVLLSENVVPELLLALELPKEEGPELVNAIRQVRTRLGLPPAHAKTAEDPARWS